MAVFQSPSSPSVANHRRWLRGACFALVPLIGVTAFLPSPVEAKIHCRDAYQVVGGQLIATPYCQDSYLARVARSYGFRYSGGQLRRSFAKKQEVCRLAGTDIRIIDICRSTLPHYRGRGF
ncbi:MAG: hypothetical protein AAFO75_07460 [Pseudomonadota bacterium]